MENSTSMRLLSVHLGWKMASIHCFIPSVQTENNTSLLVTILCRCANCIAIWFIPLWNNLPQSLSWYC